ADAVDREELDEEVALRELGEAVELQRVLADVHVRVHGDLVALLPHRGRRRVHEVAHAADVEHEALRRARDGAAAEAGDHPATFRSGGAIAWQIATASASAAWFGVGIASRPRIAFTIRPTCSLSARP